MKLDKILIVEDDMIIRLFIKKVLKTAGFEIVGEARSCEQTLDILTKTTPDLILMDIGITGDKDGVETAELIKKNADIPIMFMTGNSDFSTTERAKKIKPVEILIKPIDEFHLQNTLLKLKEKN